MCKAEMLVFVIFALCHSFTNSQKIIFDNNACHHFHSYPLRFISRDCFHNPNVMTSAPTMIEQSGFKCESHNVTTEDGYRLQLFRIPPGPDDYRKNKQPVVLEHGIFVDSGIWVFVGNRSIALDLAAQGYDVWLSNQRGTKYSQTHVNLTTSDFEYWTYTTDDVAAYDIPANLQKVADVTGKAGQIIYVGHSRGSTVGLMFASQSPQRAEQLIRGIVVLSPIVYLDVIWYIRPFARLANVLGAILYALHLPVFFYTDLLSKFAQVFCTFFPHLCYLFVVVFSGPTRQLRPEDLLSFVSLCPTSLSVRQLVQYGQFSNSKQFQKYDYGPERNVEKYGQPKPPLYNLTNIKIPVSLFYGEHDIYVSDETVRRVYDELGSDKKDCSTVLLNTTNDLYQFDHNDYLYSKFLAEFNEKQLRPAIENLRN